LLLFDEPTAAFDPVACTRIQDLISATRRHGGGLLAWSSAK